MPNVFDVLRKDHQEVLGALAEPAVRDRVADGDRLADHAVEQERAAKHALNDLIGLTADDPKFEELLRTFIADGREHIAYEETSVWPELEKVLDPEGGDELGRKLQEGKRLAPTRPHTPPKPGLLKTAGPAVAAADRARDAMTGRDKD